MRRRADAAFWQAGLATCAPTSLSGSSGPAARLTPPARAQTGELFDYIVEKGRLLEDEARHFFQQVPPAAARARRARHARGPDASCAAAQGPELAPTGILSAESHHTDVACAEAARDRLLPAAWSQFR